MSMKHVCTMIKSAVFDLKRSHTVVTHAAIKLYSHKTVFKRSFCSELN